MTKPGDSFITALAERGLQGIGIVWRVLPFTALAGLLLYPFYRHLPVGLIPLVLGLSLALAPRYLPGLAASTAHAIRSLSDVQFLLVCSIPALLVRLPLLLFPPQA